MKLLAPPKKRKKEITYKKIMGFDIETATNNNDFIKATFVSDDLKKVCYTKKAVIKFINNKKLRVYKIFATNLAFDFLGALFENSNKWSVTERNGVIYSFRWYQNESEGKLKNPIYFYDTIRIYPASVEDLGKLLNIPKIEHPENFAQVPRNLKDVKNLKDYCLNDSLISYKFISEIIIPILKKYKIKIKSTIGSIALEDFITNHLKNPIFQEDEYKRQIAFKSYYGGRTETYKRGLFQNVTCLDINSLYPSAMLNLFPNPNRSHKVKIPRIDHINKYEGVSHVLVKVPLDIYIPPLPYKKDGRLIFPVGEFKGYYNHNELRNALKYGVEILEIYETIIYPKSEYFFKSYVETHYNERLKYQKEGSALEVVEKNLLNNLYGKFAFNYLKSSSIIPVHDLDFKKHIEKAKCIIPILNGEFVSIEDLNPDVPSYSFPIWSSYITSYARITMYKYLVATQNNLIATDTDSIFIHNYNNEIVTSNELGKMKVEKGYPVKEGYFVRPKMYMTHKPKCKGLRFEKNLEIAKSQFFAVLNNEPIKQIRFIKYRTLLRSEGKLKPNQITEMTKELDLNDTKRVWETNFNAYEKQTSLPIYINYISEELTTQSKLIHKRINMSELCQKGYKHEILSLENDLIDYSAKGHDISKEEYLLNEISIELLD